MGATSFFLPAISLPICHTIENKMGKLEEEMEEGQSPLTQRAKRLCKALFTASALPRFCLEFREGQSFSYFSLVHHSKLYCLSFGVFICCFLFLWLFVSPISLFKSELSIPCSIGCSVLKPTQNSHFQPLQWCHSPGSSQQHTLISS